MSLVETTWGTTLKVKVWPLMSLWRVSISPSKWARGANRMWLNKGQKYKTLVCVLLCQCISHFFHLFNWEVLRLQSLKNLFSECWLAWPDKQRPLCQWGIRAMKRFRLKYTYAWQHPPPPTSPAFIFPFILHSCKIFLVLCINITFPQRRHIFTSNSTDEKSIYVTAIHPSLSWGWGPTVRCTNAEHETVCASL